MQSTLTDGPVVLLNTSESGSDTLIVFKSSVEHIPFLDLSLAMVHILVKLLRYAIARDTDGMPDYEFIDALVQRMQLPSERLELLRVRLAVASPLMEVEKIFQYVLGVLWELVEQPIIRALHLEVFSQFIATFSCSNICRNLFFHPQCGGGAQWDHSPFF